MRAGIVQFNADKIRPNGQANVEAAALPVSVAMAQSSDCDAVKNQKQVQGLQRLVHVVACMHIQLFCMSMLLPLSGLTRVFQ